LTLLWRRADIPDRAWTHVSFHKIDALLQRPMTQSPHALMLAARNDAIDAVDGSSTGT
jgi:hypothetical protein